MILNELQKNSRKLPRAPPIANGVPIPSSKKVLRGPQAARTLAKISPAGKCSYEDTDTTESNEIFKGGHVVTQAAKGIPASQYSDIRRNSLWKTEELKTDEVLQFEGPGQEETSDCYSRVC